MSKYGMSAKEIRYELEIDIANQLLSCHWIGLGLEVEYTKDALANNEKTLNSIKEASTREHEWNLDNL